MSKRRIYRRGNLLWWRQSIRLSNGHDVLVRLSLRTPDPAIARHRGDLLSMATVGVRRMVDGVESRKNLSLEDLAALTRAGFDEMMALIASRDLLWGPGERAKYLEHQSDFYGWVAANAGQVVSLEDELPRLKAAGWSTERIEALEYDINRYRSDYGLDDYFVEFEPWERTRRECYVDENKMGALLKGLGLESEFLKMRVAMQAMIKGYLEALHAARHLDADPLASASAFGFQGATIAGVPVGRAHLVAPQLAEVMSPAPTLCSASPAQLIPPPTLAPPPPASGISRLALSEAAERCIAACEVDEGWSRNTVGQVRLAVRLLIFAAGQDPFIENLRQSDLGRLIDLFGKLPNRYGATREEKAGGLPASLRRAEALALKDKSLVGLSQASRNRHLTWLSAVLQWAEGRGHKPAEPLNFAILRKGAGRKAKADRQRDRDKRAAWTQDEIGRLLSAPIWTGCKGLFDRFTHGEEVWHDAWYWLPLMFVLYGGRSSELVGMQLSDVHENDPIPYFKVDYSDLRRVKNLQSVRRLPVHPELIRLGFLEYITEMRALRHRMLFPEMYSPNSLSFASTFYKAIFLQWRTWAFPEGTSWKHQARGMIKDKDVHSLRGSASSIMKGRVPDSVRIDILGHEGATETLKTYDEEAELELKLEALRFLSHLTTHIEPCPLRLRPAEFQKFGKPRGRPRG